MKHYSCWGLIATFLLCMIMIPALADDAGVLSETELNTWISQVMRDSIGEQPLNAPIGEESKTEDGYAFIFSFATIYYDKPVLDANSVIRAIAVTDEAYASPRGILLGSASEILLESYGWQNPDLMGDGSFASFYRLNSLPRAAYWCWAQHDGGKIQSVRCAIHVMAGEDRYTDAGIVYTVHNGEVTGINVYGLSSFVALADVEKNLNSVMSVEAAGSGDELPQTAAPQPQSVADGYFIRSEKAGFSSADLMISNINYLSFNGNDAITLFGAVLDQQSVQDDTGEMLLITQRDGLMFSYTISGDGSRSKLESFSVTKDTLAGPRGIRIGDSTDSVLAAFQSDGQGRVLGNTSILYGDGINSPMGVLEKLDARTKDISYVTTVERDGETVTVTLHMIFVDEKLSELMIYSW